MTRLLPFLLLLLTLSSFHETDQAYFKIEQEGDYWKIEAEFPWTIRSTLLTYKPEMDTMKTTSQVEEILFSYFKENLVLLNANNKEFSILKLAKADKQNTHNHAEVYVAYYQYGDIKKIKNTMMFNYSNKHVNHHSITIDGKTTKFNTNTAKPVAIF